MKKVQSPFLLWIIIPSVLILVLIVTAAVIDRITHPAYSLSAVNTETDLPTYKIPTDAKTGTRIGDLAPDFTLNATNGKAVILSDFRGKNIILNFWATWCGPCQYEVPFLKSIDEKWSNDGVVIIAISTQDNPDSAISYVKAKNLKFLIPLDPLAKVAKLYGVRGLPTTFLINGEGVITSVKIGPFITESELEEHMKSFAQAAME